MHAIYPAAYGRTFILQLFIWLKQFAEMKLFKGSLYQKHYAESTKDWNSPKIYSAKSTFAAQYVRYDLNLTMCLNSAESRSQGSGKKRFYKRLHLMASPTGKFLQYQKYLLTFFSHLVNLVPIFQRSLFPFVYSANKTV